MSTGCLPTFVDLYLAGSDPCDPLASPVLADYSGIPPLLLQVGDFEVIRDDSIRVATRAEEHGVQVQLEVWPDMVHVFRSPRTAGESGGDRQHRCIHKISSTIDTHVQTPEQTTLLARETGSHKPENLQIKPYRCIFTHLAVTADSC